MRGEGFEFVRSGPEGQAGNVGDLFGEGFVESDGRVESGANGRPALCEQVESGQRGLDALEGVVELCDISRKFLPERQGRCVLEVRAPDLDDVVPCACVLLERVPERRDSGLQHVDDLLDGRNVHGGREGVVGGLSPIDMVVGMNRVFCAHYAPEDLDGPVGDNLVRVHVGLGSGPGLPDDEGEVVVAFALDDFLRGPDDCIAGSGFEGSVVDVCLCGGLLDDSERADERDGQGFVAYLEVAERALRLRAPVLVGGDFQGSEGITFVSCRGHAVAFLWLLVGSTYKMRRKLHITHLRTAVWLVRATMLRKVDMQDAGLFRRFFHPDGGLFAGGFFSGRFFFDGGELQPEGCRRVGEILDGIKGNRQPLQMFLERQRDGEILLADHEVFILMLHDNGHVLGICIAEFLGENDSFARCIEADVEVVVVGKALFGDLRESFPNDPAQRPLGKSIVVDGEGPGRFIAHGASMRSRTRPGRPGGG